MMSPLTIFMCFLSIGASVLSTTPPPDVHNLEWSKLIKCSQFLINFKQSIAAYRQCLGGRLAGAQLINEVWAVVPYAVQKCKVIGGPLGLFDVERIDKNDRGPLWFMRPTGNDIGSSPFSMVTFGVNRRDEEAERDLRKSIPRAQHYHGDGVALIYAGGSDVFDGRPVNFSSAGKYRQVPPSYTCANNDIESGSHPSPFLDHPASDTPPIDLLWSDDSVLTITDRPSGLLLAIDRGHLIYDGKQIDVSKICQISIRSPPYVDEVNPTNDSFWIPDLPLLPTIRICRSELSRALRSVDDQPFVPIRSGYYTTANNRTYFGEFFVNVVNPKCVAKYLANRTDVGRCEPQAIEKSRVQSDRIEMESEVVMVEGR